jgi:hypothetical protein
LEESFSMDHLSQFVELWILVSNVQLENNRKDDITWKLTKSRQYSGAAYEVQFLGAISSNMTKMVWKAWAPPKINFFTWLAT